ncbi:MAG: hypothetical protein K2K97_05180 [Muribaculaceae bacterium]|nr:hypothetical protein [Muribaculaceae bacterium]
MKKIFTLAAGIAIAATLSANAETVKLYPEDYDGNQIAAWSESEMTINEDGNIVISDFLYSEAPISFKWVDIEPGKSANMTFTGKLDRSDEYPYFLDPDGDNMTCWLWNYNNIEDWTPIYYPYAFEDGYSWLYHYDLTDPENAGFEFEYYGRICMAGYNTDNSFFGYVYVDFWFNKPTAAVDTIDASADAPAVYFNLSGQRIDNPQGGIFIRKQGNKTSKIVIR